MPGEVITEWLDTGGPLQPPSPEEWHIVGGRLDIYYDVDPNINPSICLLAIIRNYHDLRTRYGNFKWYPDGRIEPERLNTGRLVNSGAVWTIIEAEFKQWVKARIA